MPFDMIMIYTKQSVLLAVDNSEMLVIGLSLKWHQMCICPLIDHDSQPMGLAKINSGYYIIPYTE